MMQPISPVVDLSEQRQNLSQSTAQTYFVDKLFSLAVIQKRTRTRITMDVLHNQINTEKIPTIIDMLQENLPTVLTTTCYNEEGLSFSEEVQNTEIGHLFEHILLEYLCQYRISKGARRATYAGKTKWNWTRDPFGRFHIHLSCGTKDADILPLALERTVSLMKIILGYNKQPFFAIHARSSVPNGSKNGERRW
jgi:hypothetical protein